MRDWFGWIVEDRGRRVGEAGVLELGADVGADYLIFVDENGNMALYDDVGLYGEPGAQAVFTLTAMIVPVGAYRDVLVLGVRGVVGGIWGEADVHLHSRDIRRRSGVFDIFYDESLYSRFKNDMNGLLREVDPRFVSCSVDKRALSEKMALYRRETGKEYAVGDIYLDCFEYVLERAARFLGDKKGAIVFDMTTGRKKIQRMLVRCKREGGTRHPGEVFQKH